MKNRLIMLITTAAMMVLAALPAPWAHAYSSYAAMGDSVAAGAGLDISTSRSREDRACDRSAQAYPYYVAATTGTDLQFLACSGAKVDDGIYDDQRRGGVTLPPQLDEAFSSGTPQLITMTVGANDARWVQFLKQCQVTRCGTSFDNARAKIYRADLRVELYWSLYRINHMSAGDRPTVLLTGYYSPLGEETCDNLSRITTAEQDWIRARTADLNQAIYSVTEWFDNAYYVDIDFSGHELCSSDPWIQGLSSPAPFHPNAAGQRAIADAVLTTLGY